MWQWNSQLGIPMWISPVLIRAYLFLYSYEEEYMLSLISTDKIMARHSHTTRCFINNLCAINDVKRFERYVIYIQSSLTLKLNNNNHATFFNLDITIKEDSLVYKLFDKRSLFPFFNCEDASCKNQYLWKYILLSNQR